MVAYAGVAASQANPDLFSGMKWRQIGPFRGGRVVAVSGVPEDPATWYFGGVGCGVWKSTNAGNTWQPVFDEQKIASIGAIAVADSDHNIIEALHGAVNQIRTSRTEVEKLQALTAADRQSKVRNAAADFARRITAVEEQLLQVQMKASEDNLRYPNQLNEQYDTFSATIDSDDVRPTEPQQQVFAELHRRLTEQLANWKSLRDTALPPLKDELQHARVAGLPVPSGD